MNMSSKKDPFDTEALKEDFISITNESCKKKQRNIQRVKLIDFALQNILNLPLSHAGSRAEGSNDSASDTDLTYYVSNLIVYNENETIPNHVEKKFLRSKQNNCHSGYCNLEVVKARPSGELEDVYQNTRFDGTYLSTSTFLKYAQVRVSTMFSILGGSLRNADNIHGPCVTPTHVFGKAEKEPDIDVAFVIPCENWPNVAHEWLYRERSYGWPDALLIETIKGHKCGFVPIGYSGDLNLRDIEWRISFTAAERHLMWSLTGTQLLCLDILKLLISTEVAPRFPKLLCSYFMKTLIFWQIEENPSIFWRPDNLVTCLRDSISRLQKCLKTARCPHFFIRDNNMFDKKEKSDLLQASHHLNSLPIDQLILRFIQMKVNFFQKNVVFQNHIPLIGLTLSRHLMHCLSWDTLRTKISSQEPFLTALSGIDANVVEQLNRTLASTIGSVLHTTSGENMGNAMKFLELGAESDLMAGALKLATVCLWKGKVTECLDIVSRLSKIDLNQVIHYSLYYRSFIREPNDQSHPIDDQMTLQQVMARFIALDVIFLPAEISMVPDFIKFELSYRSPLFLSPILYMYCLEFSCYKEKSDARSMTISYHKFCTARALFSKGGLPHLDTDMKGYFEMELGNYQRSSKFLVSSILSRKANGPSLWLLSTLLYKYFRSEIEK